MRDHTAGGRAARRAGERGAALVTTLLVATMLFAAGAALVLTTANSGGIAGDATTEMQAYYAAEAGVQAALNVLRRNVASNPAGTSATFRNAVTSGTLGSWLTYQNVGGKSMVVVSNSPAAGYSINVSDPDGTAAADEPTRLLLRVTGYGPRGAVKQMEVLVNRSPYSLDPPAAITLIGAETGTSMTGAGDFDIGESSPKGYSGDDQAAKKSDRASFAFTNAGDQAIANAKFASDTKASDSTDDSPSRALLIQQDTLPSWLKTVTAARAFLSDIAETAYNTQTPGNASQDRYFTSSPSKDDFGTDASPLLTYVAGDCDFHGTGAGLLVVTGDLTINGGSTYNGVVLLLGNGRLIRKGGGGGGIYGALVMANFNDTSTKYLSRPTIATSGGGNSDIKFNSTNVDRAFQTLTPTVRDVREY